MKEPRARTKSFTRPDAIASIDSAHRCGLKSGRKCVDADKRRYREELYPGKTRIARINHYQCRSFTNWMRKPERGEAGAFADDPANAWRFHPGGMLASVREPDRPGQERVSGHVDVATCRADQAIFEPSTERRRD